jgi:hypothetical protein
MVGDSTATATELPLEVVTSPRLWNCPGETRSQTISLVVPLASCVPVRIRVSPTATAANRAIAAVGRVSPLRMMFPPASTVQSIRSSEPVSAVFTTETTPVVPVLTITKSGVVPFAATVFCRANLPSCVTLHEVSVSGPFPLTIPVTISWSFNVAADTRETGSPTIWPARNNALCACESPGQNSMQASATMGFNRTGVLQENAGKRFVLAALA